MATWEDLVSESGSENYFGNSNEVRIVYVYTYDVVISLIMIIACL